MSPPTVIPTPFGPMRRLHAPMWLSLLLAAGLGGCGRGEPGRDFFPLEAGHRWTYDVSSEWEGSPPERESLTLQALGEHSLEGFDGLDGRAWQRHGDSGVDYWHRCDETGIYRVASKSEADPQPRPDAVRRYVLKAPFVVGTSWQASTTAYLLRRRNEFPPEIRHSHPAIPMTYTIEAVQQKVQTAAGSHEGCLRVRGQATVRLFADPVNGWQDLPLSTREWYCPGVGLVRLERSEPASSTFLVGGVMKMELVSWQ